MKALWSKLVLLTVLLFLVGVSVKQLQKAPSDVLQEEIMVEINRQDGTIDEVELEDYLVGVVAAEMPAEFELEALKAQAVASRTIVLSRGLSVDDTVSSQVYYDKTQRKNNWQDDYDKYEKKIEAAVKQTAKEVLMYDGKYISALFFSSSNGKTENNEDYFASASVPYLKSVDSKWDLSYDGTFRTKSFTLEELNRLFQTDAFTIEITSYTKSGRVDQVEVCGKLYSGREIREKLGLASNDFEVKEEDGQFIFETVGFGHGVGMSQYGALGMAKEGYNYREILTHYYQGAYIEKIKNP